MTRGRDITRARDHDGCWIHVDDQVRDVVVGDQGTVRGFYRHGRGVTVRLHESTLVRYAADLRRGQITE